MNQMEKLLQEIDQEYEDGSLTYAEYQQTVTDILNDFDND